MLISILCDYIDAYIVVKGTITAVANESDVSTMMKQMKAQEDVTFKKNAPFKS